jgi:hypothetical protein
MLLCLAVFPQSLETWGCVRDTVQSSAPWERVFARVFTRFPARGNFTVVLSPHAHSAALFHMYGALRTPLKAGPP